MRQEIKNLAYLNRSHKYRIGCRAITVKLADGTEVVTGQNTAIQCPYCHQTCNGQKSAFQDHLQKCRPEVVWSCDHPGCEFRNLSHKIMQSHKKNVHDKVLVTCDICNIKVSKYYIKQHKLSMHADDSLKKFKVNVMCIGSCSTNVLYSVSLLCHTLHVLKF